MTDLFCDLREAWREKLPAEIWRAGITFLILWLIFFGACMVLPDVRSSLVGLVLGAINGLELTDEAGGLSALALFANNVRACGMIMVYGLLPFLYLPALSLGVNAMVLGALAAWYASEGIPLYIYLIMLLPHGIFELPALVLAFGMGLYVCGQITRRCRGDKSARAPLGCLALSAQLLAALIPLLAIAAVIETYVTPLAASFLLG